MSTEVPKYHSNRLNMNGMVITPMAVNVALEILREKGSVLIAGSPSMGEPVFLESEPALREWAEQLRRQQSGGICEHEA